MQTTDLYIYLNNNNNKSNIRKSPPKFSLIYNPHLANTENGLWSLYTKAQN